MLNKELHRQGPGAPSAVGCRSGRITNDAKPYPTERHLTGSQTALRGVVQDKALLVGLDSLGQHACNRLRRYRKLGFQLQTEAGSRRLRPRTHQVCHSWPVNCLAGVLPSPDGTESELTEPTDREMPELARLHERHHGLTEALSESYAEAAAVCLSRHHESPIRISVSADATNDSHYVLRWSRVTDRQMVAWANTDDATRDGAYSVVIGAVECHLGLVALARAKTKTGSDYMLGPSGSDVRGEDGELDLETAIRLEVSGIDRCRYESELWYRVQKKTTQTQKPRLESRGMAGVLAFNLARVVFKEP